MTNQGRGAGGVAGSIAPRTLVIVGVLAIPGLALVSALRAGMSRDSRIMRAATARLEHHFSADSCRADSAIQRAYRERNFHPLFVRSGGLTDNGSAMLEALENAPADGIDPSAWDLARLREEIDHLKDGDLTPKQRGEAAAEADLDLTLAFNHFAHDMLLGANDPSHVQKSWHIEDTDTAGSVIDRVLRGDDPSSIIDEARPASPQYRALRDILQRLRDIAEAGGWPEVRVVEDSAAVTARSLRERFAAGDDERERRLAAHAADHDAGGVLLDSAIASFQRRHGLEVNGEIDKSTLGALNVPVEERIRQTEIALERWRWMPRRLGGDVLLVNIPEFVLRFFEDGGGESFSMKVIVGKPDWETALFSSTLDHIVLNPYWNVPESILEEDLMTDLRDDPHALERKGFEMVDRNGKVIDPTDVDWNETLEKDHPSFRVRQRPGAQNALGYIKFTMPNPYHIYLHDTPADALFGRAARALSHGCIRVAQPAQLARSLLETTGSGDPGMIEPAMESRETRTIDLKSPVRVYLTYLTVWVEPDGTARFLSDVYGFDRSFDGTVAATQADATH